MFHALIAAVQMPTLFMTMVISTASNVTPTPLQKIQTNRCGNPKLVLVSNYVDKPSGYLNVVCPNKCVSGSKSTKMENNCSFTTSMKTIA